MKRQILENILISDGYKVNSINSILCGRRKPNAEKRYEYEKKYNIPFTAWQDIKSYLQENDTKQSTTKTTTKQEEEVAS